MGIPCPADISPSPKLFGVQVVEVTKKESNRHWYSERKIVACLEDCERHGMVPSIPIVE